MVDKRTMSAVTMINTAQWNRRKVNVVMALTQVRAFYFVQNKPRVRTFSLPLSLPIPAIRSSLSNSSILSGCFVPLTMMRAKKRQEESGTTMKWGTSIYVPPRLRRVLCCLLMRTTRLNLCSDELPKILADVPIWRVKPTKSPRGQLLRRTRWSSKMAVCPS